MKRYDVFISYRRDGGDMTATRLYDSIAGRRYRVFLDVKTLGPCEFDQRLIDVIKNCRDFVLVLSPGSLDRCWNEDDWVRREIECAIYNGVNIIPVLLPGFRFPENLPESIRRVSSHNGIEANPNFWDAFLDKLEGFLFARKKVRWYLAPAAVAAAVAVAAAGIFVLKSAAPETYRQAELVVMTGEASFQKGKAFYDQKDYAQALPYIEKAAEKDHAGALDTLGDMFYNGYGVTQDYAQALRCYEEAERLGSKDNLARLGSMYMHAKGCEDTEENRAKGVAYCEKSEDLEAYNDLGGAYENGTGVMPDIPKAIEYYTKAAEMGNGRAMCGLGNIYYEGRNVGAVEIPVDFGKAFDWYIKAEETGYEDVPYERLGWMYLTGNGTDKKHWQAKICLERAVEKKNTDAMVFLGNMYMDGEEIAQDINEAIKYYEMASNHGDVQGDYYLGTLYDQGIGGLREDNHYAEACYRKAAEAGHSLAMLRLAYLYDGNAFGEPDYIVANEWFQKAAVAGEADAVYHLGSHCQYGKGFEKVDLKSAFELYKVGAHLGSGRAMRCLGDLYRDGIYVEKNTTIAKEWYLKAIEKGDAEAEESLYSCMDGDELYVLALEKYEKQEYDHAKRYFEEAAKKNHGKAMGYLCFMYATATGVEKDYAKAEEWRKADASGACEQTLDELAKQSDAQTIKKLGDYYASGENKERNNARAINAYQRALELGNTDSIIYDWLGWLYANNGEETDYEKALLYYEMGVDAGSGYSMCQIGNIYRDGNIGDVDFEKAVECYQKAFEMGYTDAENSISNLIGIKNSMTANEMCSKGNDWYSQKEYQKALICWKWAIEKGSVDAMFSCGYLYDTGKGVNEDDATAAVYYEKAIELGSGKACDRLALIYYNGCESIPADKVKAFELYRKGAEAYGDSGCMGNLGIMYQYGHGTDIDYDLALAWYLKASEEGNGSATRCAGNMYRDGIGVPEDKERARELYQLAADLGDAEAQKRLDELQ